MNSKYEGQSCVYRETHERKITQYAKHTTKHYTRSSCSFNIWLSQNVIFFSLVFSQRCRFQWTKHNANWRWWHVRSILIYANGQKPLNVPQFWSQNQILLIINIYEIHSNNKKIIMFCWVLSIYESKSNRMPWTWSQAISRHAVLERPLFEQATASNSSTNKN